MGVIKQFITFGGHHLVQDERVGIARAEGGVNFEGSMSGVAHGSHGTSPAALQVVANMLASRATRQLLRKQ